MSEETKRDVFDDALRALEEFGEQGSSWEMAYDDLSARYSAASDDTLPDDMPVIPKAVGDAITYAKADGISIGAVLWRCGEGGMFDCDEVESWINEHGDTFARAWVLGAWRVEESGEIVKLEAEK